MLANVASWPTPTRSKVLCMKLSNPGICRQPDSANLNANILSKSKSEMEINVEEINRTSEISFFTCLIHSSHVPMKIMAKEDGKIPILIKVVL